MTEDEFRKQDNTEPAFSGYEQGESLNPIDKLIAERDALVEALRIADEFINACLKFGIDTRYAECPEGSFVVSRAELEGMGKADFEGIPNHLANFYEGYKP